MPELTQCVLAVVAGLDLSLVNLSLSSFLTSTSSTSSSASSSAVVRVMQSEFGASLVLGLVRRGQKLAESSQDPPNRAYEEWYDWLYLWHSFSWRFCMCVQLQVHCVIPLIGHDYEKFFLMVHLIACECSFLSFISSLHDCVVLCMKGAAMHRNIIITPHACAGVKWSVVSSLSLLSSWTQKSPNLEMYAPERVVSTTNMLNLARNWLQYVQNQVARPARVINRVF